MKSSEEARPAGREESFATPPAPKRADRARDAWSRGADWTWGVARRIHLGTRQPANWVQLFKFGVVGALGLRDQPGRLRRSGRAGRLHHIVAAIGAFCVAVTNNFLWNRHWTFQAGAGHAGFQAGGFFTR